MSIKDQINDLAQSTFEVIERTEQAFKTAEKQHNDTSPRNGFVDAEYAAKAARVEADYQAALAAYISMKRNLPGKVQGQLSQIRKEYAEAVARQYAIDPAKLDTNSLELLKSGIMKPAEYSAMMEAAKKDGNATMVRMIAKYAAEAAEAAARKNGENSQQARELRMVGYSGNIDPGKAALETFDHIGEIFRRCVNNPAMIKHWDGLAGPLLDML